MASCTKKELEFWVFLVYKVAEYTNLTVPEIYARLTDSGILDEYIIPFYDVLHTLGDRYLVNDITEMMQEWGCPE